ncbi:MAG: hypothetical protein MJZ86_02045 [Bacteroidales bacterium]|nr:hypothetical protein [Bacteroidales bacterium]
MGKELDNVFEDVRRAFRLLSRYQSRVLDIVDYIREQAGFSNIYGKKDWYSYEIGQNRQTEDNYAHLSVFKDMWGLDFLYNHFFEFYFGDTPKNIGKQYEAQMSVFQVSDDGYFASSKEKKSMTDVDSFANPEESHSYLVFYVSLYRNQKESLWLKGTYEEEWKDFLTSFLESTELESIEKIGKGGFNILKKYPMQQFANQTSTDAVIRDFANIVFKQTGGGKLFKEEYYQ